MHVILGSACVSVRLFCVASSYSSPSPWEIFAVWVQIHTDVQDEPNNDLEVEEGQATISEGFQGCQIQFQDECCNICHTHRAERQMTSCSCSSRSRPQVAALATGFCTHHRQTMLRRQGPVTATKSQCHSLTRYAVKASSMFPTLQKMLVRTPEKVRCSMSTHSIPVRGRQCSAGSHRASSGEGLRVFVRRAK